MIDIQLDTCNYTEPHATQPTLEFVQRRRRRRRHLFGSNSITYNYTDDKIKQISRARLPENPEVNHAGHPNIQFLVYHETTTTILLKTHKDTNTEKSDYTLADDELWTNQVFISNKFTVK